MSLSVRPAGLAGAVAGAAVLALAACGSSATNFEPVPAASATVGSPAVESLSAGPLGWAVLPASPLPELDQRVNGVWTGKELLVAGTTERELVMAAAYDPVRRSWRRLPSLPSKRGQSQGEPQAVWTGTEMLIWGGSHHEALNPATGSWREVPRPDKATPVGASFALVSTGTQVIGFGGYDGGYLATGGSWDPATNTWTALPKGPLTARVTSAAWTGSEVVFVGGEGAGPQDPESQAPLKDVAAYNPATRTWRELAPMPFAGKVQAHWDGKRLIAVGDKQAAAFSPDTNTWTPLGTGLKERDDAASVLAGDRLVVMGGWVPGSDPAKVAGGGQSYSFTSNTWSTLPKAPVADRFGRVLVWTGTRVLAWGGYRQQPDGIEFTP